MAEPLSKALRQPAVEAYERGDGGYATIAKKSGREDLFGSLSGDRGTTRHFND
jgi:hypothetical protein